MDITVINTEARMAKAKVFRSGNSQAVRLPKRFRLNSDEVEIFRRRDEIVLREKPKDLTRAFELFCGLPDLDRENAPPQERRSR
jgi:antitoxin VapB